MIKYYLIDPPEGHKYGFPKMMSEEDYKNQHLKSLSQWCIDNGYPKEVVEEYGDVFFIKSTGPIVNPKLKKAFEDFACSVFNTHYRQVISFRELAEKRSEEWIKNNL